MKDGRKIRHHAGGEVGEALAVRADEPHAGSARRAHHLLLYAKARIAGLAEARGHDDRDLYTLRSASMHRAHRLVAADGDDRKLGRFRYILQCGKRPQALNRSASRIDRVDRAAVAIALQV